MHNFKVSQKDTLNGILLKNTNQKQWQCPDPSIKNIDLWNAPNLEQLNLSLCQAGMHLMLVNCPNIKEVILPKGEACVIHLDSPTPPQIEFQGAISSIDACWGEEKLMLDLPHNKSWHNIYLAPASELTNPAAFAHQELALVYGNSTSSKFELNLAPARQVVWLNSGNLEELEVTQPLTSLQLLNAPKLKKLSTNNLVKDLHLRDVQLLQTIAGDLHTANLAKHRGTGLVEFTGKIENLNLQTTSISELIADKVISLNLSFCNGLTKVKLPSKCAVYCEGYIPAQLRNTAKVFVNEATINQRIAEFKQGKEAALADLQPLIKYLLEPVQIPRALKLLHQLILEGAPLEWVWQARMELSARHLKRGRQAIKHLDEPLTQGNFKNAASQWRWMLPRDLCENAWIDDWRIWLACKEVAEAKAYKKVIQRSLRNSIQNDASNADQPMELQAWIMHWLTNGDLADLEVQQLLTQSLNHLSNQQAANFDAFSLFSKTKMKEGISSALLEHLKQYLQSLGSYEEQLDAAILGYELSSLEIKEVLEALLSLSKTEPEKARNKLIELSTKPLSFWENRGTNEEVNNFPRQARAAALTIAMTA